LFVALIIPFIYEDKPWHSIEQTHPLTSGIHDSKHASVPKANILNTLHKLICVEKLTNNIPREHLQQLKLRRTRRFLP